MSKRNLSEGPFECPKCHMVCELAIAATTTVTLVVNDDGAVSDSLEYGGHSYNADSAAECRSCNHKAPLREFTMPSPRDDSLPRHDAGQWECPHCKSTHFTRFSVDNFGDGDHGDADVTCRCWDCGHDWREPGEMECPECKGLDHTTNFEFVDPDEWKAEPGWLCDSCFGDYVSRKYNEVLAKG